MLVSRGLALTRLCSYLGKNILLQKKNNLNYQIIRKYYLYRTKTPKEEKNFLLEITGAIFWWWILWHVFTDYQKLLPHSFPDPSEWTDEELGIPPEDE